MSSNILRDEGNILCGDGSIVAGMKRKETLGEYIERIRHAEDPPLSYPDIERRSRGGITANYIGMLARGEQKNPTIDKIAALAVGLRRPELEVYAVARGLELSEDEIVNGRVATLVNRARELSSKDDQRWFSDMLDMIDRELERRMKAREK
jgi:transcriptional regulator with XRE-family HTH domain